MTISAKLLVDGENVYSQFISIDIENTVFPNQIESVEGVVNLNSRESKNIKLNDFNAYSLYSTQKGEGSIEANYWWTLKAPTSQVTSDHGPIIQKLTVDF